MLRTQIIVELSLSSLYFCGENIVPLSTRVCVRAPGLKNNAGIYCLAINVSITCQNYSSAVSIKPFSHAVLLLLLHHILLYNSYCSIVFWDSRRWPIKRLPYWFYEMNFSRLSYFSAIFSTFVLVLKCSRQRVNDTFRRSWVYLTVIGELAFLVWIAECVSTTTCNQHVASTPWRREIRYECTLYGVLLAAINY